MNDKRAWLQECEGAYQSLLAICEENTLPYKYSDFRNNLSNFVSKIFPIFHDMSFMRAEFLFHDRERIHSIYNKRLYLCVYFPKKNFQSVKQWFDEQGYNDYIICESNELKESVLKIPVQSIIDKMIQVEIKLLRMDCEEKAKPFLEGKENELLSDYEEECLEKDPYYLGVKFVSYSGKYPIFCQGTIILEIEGIEYALKTHDIFKFTRELKPKDLPINFRRYYYEIIRVIDENIQGGCCGGCE